MGLSGDRVAQVVSRTHLAHLESLALGFLGTHTHAKTNTHKHTHTRVLAGDARAVSFCAAHIIHTLVA